MGRVTGRQQKEKTKTDVTEKVGREECFKALATCLNVTCRSNVSTPRTRSACGTHAVGRNRKGNSECGEKKKKEKGRPMWAVRGKQDLIQLRTQFTLTSVTTPFPPTFFIFLPSLRLPLSYLSPHYPHGRLSRQSHSKALQMSLCPMRQSLQSSRAPG
jgi:hypothetical protein